MSPGEKGVFNLQRLCWFAFPVVFMCLFGFIGWTYAADVDIQVEFSFDTNAVEGKTVEGYSFKRDDVELERILAADLTTDLFKVPCIDTPAGAADFTLNAVYTDETESPDSQPFPFTVPVCESTVILRMSTNVTP